VNEEELKAELEAALAQNAALTAELEKLREDADEEKARADRAEGELATARHRMDELSKERADAVEVDKLRKTIKGLTTQIQREKQARLDAESPERLRKAVQDRVTLEGKALAVLGDQVRLDAMSDRQVMVAVIENLQGATITDKDSDDYVRARFDSATESYQRGSDALAKLREASEARVNERRHERTDAASARQKMIDRNQNAWKGAQGQA
jgi:hypothetical protein